MTITCLLCDSRAVLDKDAALGAALFINMASSLFEGCQPIAIQPSQDSTQPGDDANDLLLNTLRNVFKRAQLNTQLLDDIGKYQFGGFNRLCLRCGTRFN